MSAPGGKLGSGLEASDCSSIRNLNSQENRNTKGDSENVQPCEQRTPPGLPHDLPPKQACEAKGHIPLGG